jgi:hypothetical protein
MPSKVHFTALGLLLIQCRPDLGCHLFHGKRLLDKIHAVFEYAPMGDHVGRIAGHEQGFYIRVEGVYPIGQIAAVHFGQDRVGDEYLDFPPVLIGTAYFVPIRNNIFLPSIFCIDNPVLLCSIDSHKRYSSGHRAER